MKRIVITLMIVTILLPIATAKTYGKYSNYQNIVGIDLTQIPLDKGRATIKITIPSNWKDTTYVVTVYLPPQIVATGSENFMDGNSVFTTYLRPGQTASLTIQSKMVGTYKIPVQIDDPQNRETVYFTELKVLVYDPRVLSNEENNEIVNNAINVISDIAHSDTTTKVAIGLIVIVIILALKGRSKPVKIDPTTIENGSYSIFKDNVKEELFEITIDPKNNKIDIKRIGEAKPEINLDEIIGGETLISFSNEKSKS